MRPIRAWFLRILGLFQKTRRDREFAEELEAHVHCSRPASRPVPFRPGAR